MKNAAIPARVASLLLCALLLAGSTGCRKDAPPPQWDVDLLLPLVKGSLDIRDLIADSLLETGQDGVVMLRYSDVLFDLSLDTILQAPDTSFDHRFALPVPGPLQFGPGVQFYDQQDVTRFDLGDVQLRRLVLREGFLDLSLRNMIQSVVIGSFSLPGATFQGETLTREQAVGPGTPGMPTTAVTTVDISGYSFDLRGPLGNGVNTLASAVSARLDPNGQGASVTNMDSLIALITYRGLVPQYALGYFGSQVYEAEEEETTLDLFNPVIAGAIDLDQVTMRLKVSNGLGADVQVFIRELISENSRTGNIVPLSHAILNGPVNLTRALDLGWTALPFMLERVLDNGNSNIDLFVENLPDRLRYALEVRLNPLGDISNGNDFLYHDSRIEARAELEIPLRFSATGLTLETTITPELGGNADAHALQSGRLMLFAENGFPFDAQVELAIVDEGGTVLSQVDVPGTVPHGFLNGEGLVTAPGVGRLDITLAPPQVDLLHTGGRFRLRAVLNTAQQGTLLPILEHYRIDLRITAAANYILNGNE